MVFQDGNHDALLCRPECRTDRRFTLGAFRRKILLGVPIWVPIAKTRIAKPGAHEKGHGKNRVHLSDADGTRTRNHRIDSPSNPLDSTRKKPSENRASATTCTNTCTDTLIADAESVVADLVSLVGADCLLRLVWGQSAVSANCG